MHVVLDRPTASTSVGSIAISNTGGWQNWKTVTTSISKVTGIHSVYLIFASAQPQEFVNVNWFSFASHGLIDAKSHIRAENFDSNNGVQTEPTTDQEGGRNTGWIANGDWVGFNNVDFGDGLTKFTARVSSGAPNGIGGQMQVA